MREGDNKRGDSEAPIRERGPEWDELWKNKPTMFHDLWLDRVKAEGDRLKEKADLWTRFSVTTLAQMIAWLRDSDKLEAIEGIVKKWGGTYPGPLAMGDIKRVLEEVTDAE